MTLNSVCEVLGLCLHKKKKAKLQKKFCFVTEAQMFVSGVQGMNFSLPAAAER